MAGPFDGHHRAIDDRALGDGPRGHEAAPRLLVHLVLLRAGTKLEPIAHGRLHLTDLSHHRRELAGLDRERMVRPGQRAAQREVLLDHARPQRRRRHRDVDAEAVI